MAKVKGIQEQQKRIIRIVAGALASTAQLKDTESMIRTMIRSGKLPSGASVKGLAKSTIDRRRKLSEVNSTHPDFSAAKSNLTFSGQLIDSIKGTARILTNKLIIQFAPVGIHKGPNLLRGGRAKGTTNQKIAAGQANMGRDIRKGGPQIRDAILKLIRAALTKSIRKG